MERSRQCCGVVRVILTQASEQEQLNLRARMHLPLWGQRRGCGVTSLGADPGTAGGPRAGSRATTRRSSLSHADSEPWYFPGVTEAKLPL